MHQNAQVMYLWIKPLVFIQAKTCKLIIIMIIMIIIQTSLRHAPLLFQLVAVFGPTQTNKQAWHVTIHGFAFSILQQELRHTLWLLLARCKRSNKVCWRHKDFIHVRPTMDNLQCRKIPEHFVRSAVLSDSVFVLNNLS